MKYRIKHIVEYGVLRFVAGIVHILPHRVGLGVGWILGWLSFYVFRWRAAEAQRRIREVFGDRFSDREVRHIAWLSMRNFCFNVIEMVRLTPRNTNWAKSIITFENFEYCFHEGDKGAVVASPHAGNWELSSIVAGLKGVPLFVIFAKQRNPLFSNYVDRLRGVTGIVRLSRENPMLLREVIRNLKAGKTLAFTNDLRAKTPALPIRFLGKEANIVEGMGVFTKLAKVPVVPAVTQRIGWTRHHVTFFPPIHPDPSLKREEDNIRMTQLVMDIFTAEIRKHPEQYFWYNKRWVLDPLEKKG